MSEEPLRRWKVKAKREKNIVQRRKLLEHNLSPCCSLLFGKRSLPTIDFGSWKESRASHSYVTVSSYHNCKHSTWERVCLPSAWKCRNSNLFCTLEHSPIKNQTQFDAIDTDNNLLLKEDWYYNPEWMEQGKHCVVNWKGNEEGSSF